MLRHISQGMSRALSCLPQQPWPPSSLPLQPSTWVDGLIRETAAASQAAAQWQAVLAAEGGAAANLTGWIKGMDWACLDACLALTALTATPTASAQAQHSALGAAAAGSALVAYAAERLPPGALQADVLVWLTVQALDALQWTTDAALLHLLRCLRHVWALAVQDSALQVRPVPSRGLQAHTHTQPLVKAEACAACCPNALGLHMYAAPCSTQCHSQQPDLTSLRHAQNLP